MTTMTHQSDMVTMNNNNNKNKTKRYNNCEKKRHSFSFKGVLFEVDTKYMPISREIIGEGAYGVVCSFIDRKANDEKVAIKKISNVFEKDVEALRILRELKILRHCRHENIIGLKGVMVGSSFKSNFKDIYLVYELMDHDLHQIIRLSQKTNSCLSQSHIQCFMFQLLKGLNYLHSANILHRDLKPQNLLVNADFHLKICDFGLARTNRCQGKPPMTEYVVTRWYRAPELLLGCDNYGASVDMWSVGCIFAELLGGKPIFPGKDELDQIKHIIKIVGTPSNSDLKFVTSHRILNFLDSLPFSSGQAMLQLYPGSDPFALDLLWKMLEFNPKKRITVSQALKHQYMSDLCDPKLLGLAPFPCNLDMDSNIGVDKIRNLIWNEMMLYHPEPVGSFRF